MSSISLTHPEPLHQLYPEYCISTNLSKPDGLSLQSSSSLSHSFQSQCPHKHRLATKKTIYIWHQRRETNPYLKTDRPDPNNTHTHTLYLSITQQHNHGNDTRPVGCGVEIGSGLEWYQWKCVRCLCDWLHLCTCVYVFVFRSVLWWTRIGSAAHVGSVSHVCALRFK